MNSSDYWEQSSFHRPDSNISQNTNTTADSSHHRVQIQEEIPQSELLDSIASANASDYNVNQQQALGTDDDSENDEGNMGISHGSPIEPDEEDEDNYHHHSHHHSSMDIHHQPSLEQIQRVYYTKGLQELESLHLLDLSPLANWKLSSSKLGFGLSQLRDDSPDSFWQSDGSNGNNHNGNNQNNGSNNGGSNNGNNGNSNNGGITNANNELTNPHSIIIQFSKKVSIERVSIFTNFSIDESYTPSKIQILAGSSDGWDLSEVCVVSFNKPIGWSHIIFNGIRADGVLKCFIIKLVVLSNHQDGKDTHIRAVKVFGKKQKLKQQPNTQSVNLSRGINHSDILKDISASSGLGFGNVSGISLNSSRHRRLKSSDSIDEDSLEADVIQKENTVEEDQEELDVEVDEDTNTTENSTAMNNTLGVTLENVSEIIGFNSGFQSLEMKSISSIR
ncbi:hypothetical protein CLIB1423_16S02542 [[Candida] railenensis]|uniref:DOC domain-containing protein n=1 Tax=[Candida] railenensis TaxID=45579 RepID=A0A9P0QTG3_9ASCO|nr:hypothetical protein CLIB1423_16S02542 [[Candida] railenensis]